MRVPVRRPGALRRGGSGGRAGVDELAGHSGAPRRRPRRATRTSGPAAVGSSASVSSITAAMSRKRSRPARKAWTATSLAAFSVHGAVPPAARRPPGPAAGRLNVSSSTGSNVSAPTSTRSSGADRDVDPLGVVQRVGDRHPHVRIAEVGQRGAVAQLDQAVDDRLGVDDDVDLLVGRPEQVVGLDQLEALVHQRGRVDRDLAAHRPGRMRERLLDGHAARARRPLRPRNGPPEAVRISRSTVPGALGGEQLVERGVLGVDRDDRGAGGLRERVTSSPPDHQRLLVGQRQVDPLGQRRDRRHQPRRADDRVQHQVALAVGDQPDDARPARPAPRRRSRPRWPRGRVRVGERHPRTPWRARLLEQRLPGVGGAQRDDRELRAGARDDVEGLDADRAGGAEDREAARHARL